MEKKQFWINLIIAGMALGTTWAIRGQFGHEQGAAWAGAVGGLAVLLLARREDWYGKMFKATLAAAVGWGLGGIMSYGRVVGFGRGVDFVNVFYGLLMLFVIGGLYGFIGGGLFGLTLAETEKKKVNWPLLFVGAVAGGITTYYFLIMEWEFLMTPPRSEAWAGVLGAAIFMLWFMRKYRFDNAVRVAVFAGLGGGFGFAFGNFLQVLGNVMEIKFNMWNVMEYSLGFFGGAGMAYGTFTSKWDEGAKGQYRKSNFIPMLMATLFIPFVVWQQSFNMEDLQKTYENIISGDAAPAASWVQVVTFVILILMVAWVMVVYYYQRQGDRVGYTHNDVLKYFAALFGVYMVYSWLRTGAVVSAYRIEQYLYLVNYIIVLWVLPKRKPVFLPRTSSTEKWMMYFLLVLFMIAVLAIIAINTHGEMGGMNKRFDI